MGSNHDKYQKGRAWIELNMDNLTHNVKQLQKLLPKGCALMPAVKANAYGHGAVRIGLKLAEMGIKDYCVASASEAIELRRAGITGQILILGYTSPCQFQDLVNYQLTQTVVDLAYARALNDYGHPLWVHVGIDTGMHRLGERSEDVENICEIWRLEHLKITGVYSHLSASDGNSEAEITFTRKQITEFQEVVKALNQRGIVGFKTHLQGSYGVLNYPELEFDYARVGIALYGTLSMSSDRIKADAELRPVLSLKARITCVKALHENEAAGYGLAFRADREMRIAAASIGYADGIPRELSNKGYALVNGYRAAVVGRVCMDQLLLDVSDVPKVSAGDEAVFIGKSGEQEILACEAAERAGTISNEILSRLGSRVERV
ncbi:serine racemase VanT catalytic subunit [Lachnospiraceae bacterium WCA-9-b2]|jgi:alanine racemase|uniref:Alanine racemase n=1 Tax=Sporofaciens musculi TaxID=2681861 RepID=A0A7X3MG02_9FIRM|nr:serine racemase VanT catalytic subunit [Sporofaciens musculi]MXP75736.1 serine racemase VanT catalytic subunit [Sporofaciens musculi]